MFTAFTAFTVCVCVCVCACVRGCVGVWVCVCVCAGTGGMRIQPADAAKTAMRALFAYFVSTEEAEELAVQDLSREAEEAEASGLSTTAPSAVGVGGLELVRIVCYEPHVLKAFKAARSDLLNTPTLESELVGINF